VRVDLAPRPPGAGDLIDVGTVVTVVVFVVKVGVEWGRRLACLIPAPQAQGFCEA
jgi:hypothetical protein